MNKDGRNYVKYSENVHIGNNVKFYSEVEIGNNSYIGDNVIIGHPTDEQIEQFLKDSKDGNKEIDNIVEGRIKIGKNSIILPGTIIYPGTTIGDDFWCDTNTFIGMNTTIGNNTWFQYGTRVYHRCKIGNNCTLAGFVCNDAIIGDTVNMLGYLVHKFKQSERGLREKSPVIEDEATVGMLAIVIGNVTVGKGAYIGAGSVVTKDVKPYTTVLGNPCRELRNASFSFKTRPNIGRKQTT